MTEKEQKAHDLFFQTNLNQQQIADLLSINRKTLYGWIKEGNWIRARCAASYAPVVLAQQYYAQLAALNSKIADREDPYPTKEEADIQRKISMTINQIRNEKRTCSETIELFTNFTSVLRKKDNELLKKVIVHMDNYIQEISVEGLYDKRGKHHREEKEFEKEYQQWVASHQPPSPPDSPEPPAEPPVVPVGPNTPIIPGSSDGHTPEGNCDESASLPDFFTPSPSAPSLQSLKSGVQNGVYTKQHNSLKPATTAGISENDNKNFSTITKLKKGVAIPSNRRERRLQQRMNNRDQAPE